MDEVDQSGDQQPANPAKRDAQSAFLKHKTPGQVGYEPYSCHLGVKGFWWEGPFRPLRLLPREMPAKI